MAEQIQQNLHSNPSNLSEQNNHQKVPFKTGAELHSGDSPESMSLVKKAIEVHLSQMQAKSKTPSLLNKNNYSLLMDGAGGTRSEMYRKSQEQSSSQNQDRNPKNAITSSVTDRQFIARKPKDRQMGKIYDMISTMRDEEERTSAKNSISYHQQYLEEDLINVRKNDHREERDYDEKTHSKSSVNTKSDNIAEKECHSRQKHYNNNLVLKSTPTKIKLQTKQAENSKINPTVISKGSAIEDEKSSWHLQKRAVYTRVTKNKNTFQLQLERQESVLYKSLPQPFINKKLIHSFDQGHLKSNDDYSPSKTKSNFDKVAFVPSKNNASHSNPNEYFKNRASSIQNRKYVDSLNKELKSLEASYLKNAQNRQKIIQQSYSIGVDIEQASEHRQNNNIVKRNAYASRYKKKKLEPLNNPSSPHSKQSKPKMSNNIRDYLSVEKIEIKEIQEQLMINEKLAKEKEKQYHLHMGGMNAQILRKKANSQIERGQNGCFAFTKRKTANCVSLNPVSNNNQAYESTGYLLNMGSSKADQSKIAYPRKKFKAAFQMYFYKDFLWKVAFSNQMLIESPREYPAKVKVFLGKGNNSNLIKSIIKRRSWMQVIDKIQEASFAWTQIKNQAFFQQQKPTKKIGKEFKNVNMELKDFDVEAESPLLQKTNQRSDSHKLFNQVENIQFRDYWKLNAEREAKFKFETLSKNRSRALNINEVKVEKVLESVKVHNHFKNNFIIGNKKALFHTMSHYYSKNAPPASEHQNDKDSQEVDEVFKFLPLTFHIKKGLQDDSYLKFLKHFYAISKQIKRLTAAESSSAQLKKYPYRHNAWIVKPGENTNRGNGIIVCLSLNEIKAILKKEQKHNDGTYKTYIIQKYIEKPLLYKKRKFDIRHYIMVTCSNGQLKGYWYQQGYIRTTSSEYTLKFSAGSVHLTNDAVQKQLPDYGKYQKGNKITYEELNSYIKQKVDKKFDFYRDVLPKMKPIFQEISTDVMRASAKHMDPSKPLNNFELFGLDFMIEENYDVKLIEVNSNPCLEVSCPLLTKIIPPMIENIFRICVDPVFPPPLNWNPNSVHLKHFTENANEQNLFELVYDQRVEESKRNSKSEVGAQGTLIDSKNDDCSSGDSDLQKVKEEAQLFNNQDFEDDDDVFDDEGQALED